jgi:hypothetical protein
LQVAKPAAGYWRVQQLNTKRPGGLFAAALTIAALTFAPGQPAAEAHERPAPAAVHDDAPLSVPGGSTTARPPLASETYAAREADAPKLATFEGGDRVVVFAGSTVVVVLLVVLIVVLL